MSGELVEAREEADLLRLRLDLAEQEEAVAKRALTTVHSLGCSQG